MNNEAPERVWITWDDAYPWPTPEMGGDEYIRADLAHVDPPAAPVENYRLDINHQMYEDDLPADISKALYDQWFAKSRIVDGVRMGPSVEPIAPAAPDERDKALARQLLRDCEQRTGDRFS